MKVQFIHSPSGEEMAILSRADYERLREQVEEAGDARDAAGILARIRSGAEDAVPAAVARRLVAGESPVKIWREHRGLTQERLAAAASMSKMYLSQIERGERQGSVRLLRRLADALDVDLDDLALQDH